MQAIGIGFDEKMSGRWSGGVGSARGGEFYFDVVRELDGSVHGRLTMDGVAHDVLATGTLEISPFWKRTIHYVLDFTGKDGTRYRFDGTKRIRHLRPLTSWTTLPGTVTEVQTGREVATVVARFDVRNRLGELVRSFRWARTRR